MKDKIDRNTAIYRLAEKLVHTQKALEAANRILTNTGLMFALIPDRTPPFCEASTFHAKVRKEIKEANGFIF